MTQFEALYGYKAPNMTWTTDSRVKAVQDVMQHREQLNSLLREQLLKATNRIKQMSDKQMSDKHRAYREFQIGDEVYLKLQPYKQTSLALRRNLKLTARYFGPYKIQNRIGQVAYKLDLPANLKIHPIFHVSLLKKKVGKKGLISIDPPEVASNGQLKIYPAVVLDQRVITRQNRAVIQLFIQWTNMRPTELTWEDYTVLR
ncbi:uncharacterized protein LOC120122251 [Hibiscus syriacus]|uniref:uncharacterized protein LOC120122251 n=1 Tax=Hibiscus syriacus TaxID=106335 RepID=UPI001922538A|nr:uncharacterized protein LOC120122251 [Hibiscus syriacus]